MTPIRTLNELLTNVSMYISAMMGADGVCSFATAKQDIMQILSNDAGQMVFLSGTDNVLYLIIMRSLPSSHECTLFVCLLI